MTMLFKCQITVEGISISNHNTSYLSYLLILLKILIIILNSNVECTAERNCGLSIIREIRINFIDINVNYRPPSVLDRKLIFVFLRSPLVFLC